MGWTVDFELYAHQAPPSMGFSRQEYWIRLPFPSPGDLPGPGIEPRSPALQADTLTSEPPGNPSKGSHPLIYGNNIPTGKPSPRRKSPRAIRCLKEYSNYLYNRIESYILLCLLGCDHKPIDNCPLFTT